MLSIIIFNASHTKDVETFFHQI